MRCRQVLVAAFAAVVLLSTSSCSDEPAPAARETLVPIVEPTPKDVPSSALVGMAETPKGKVIVDGRRHVVYVHDKDTPVKDGKGGASACVDSCTETWQPLTTESGMAVALPGVVPGALGVFQRPDGTKQVTFNGRLLYLYTKDTKPLEANGDGVDGQWHVAVP